jgi:hypothetical protein
MTGFAGDGTPRRRECGDRFILEPVSPRCGRVIPDTPAIYVEPPGLSVPESMLRERAGSLAAIDGRTHCGACRSFGLKPLTMAHGLSVLGLLSHDSGDLTESVRGCQPDWPVAASISWTSRPFAKGFTKISASRVSGSGHGSRASSGLFRLRPLRVASIAEAGGTIPRGPVERRGRHVMIPLDGFVTGASKFITVYMKQQRLRSRVRGGALIHSGSRPVSSQ